MSREEIPEYNFREEYEPLGFEVIKLEYFYTLHSTEERTNPHRLKFYALIYITKGQDTHIIDFVPHSFKEGSLLFVSKNQIQFNDLSYSYPYNYNLYSPMWSV